MTNSTERDEAVERFVDQLFAAREAITAPGKPSTPETVQSIYDQIYAKGFRAALTSKAVRDLLDASTTILQMFGPIEKPDTAGSEVLSKIRAALAQFKRECGCEE